MYTGGFHNRVYHWLNGTQPWWRIVKDYISLHQNTVVNYIVTRMILWIFLGTERRTISRASMWWQKQGGSILHVFHVAGTRMKEFGVDGLSKGDLPEGIFKGGNPLQYFPFDKSIWG